MTINKKKPLFDLIIVLIVVVVVAISLSAIYCISRADWAWIHWPLVPVGYGYYKDGNDIVIEPYTFKQYLELDGPSQEVNVKIDVKSFEALSEKWGEDKDHLYFIYSMGEDCCYARVLPLSVDMDSFRKLDYWYAVDKNHVYKNDKIVEGVDPNNFTPPPPSAK
jgi:hypothetical protein